MPPLDAAYAGWPIWPSNAAIDAVLMMTPRSPASSGAFSVITAAASRITLNVPTRLTRIVFSNRSSGCGPFLPSTFAAGPMPAALTTP